jgi:hypothetical protein
MIWDLLDREACQSVKDSTGIEVKFPLHPLTFLSYSTLIDLHNADKNTLQPSPLFESSLRLETPKCIEIIPWASERFNENEWDLLLSSMSTEPVFPRDLEPPSKNKYSLSCIYLKHILNYLSTNSPQYYELLRSTINTIILARPGKISRAQNYTFGGATYFFFWKGTIINSDSLNSYLNFFEQVIHESCHMALFMLCSKYGILCTNPDTQLYDSVFRKDSGRPMHGVIHAYFVAKNLAECFKNLPHVYKKNKTSSDRLYEEISAHANLTPFGKFILDYPEIINLERLVESNLEI